MNICFMIVLTLAVNILEKKDFLLTITNRPGYFFGSVNESMSFVETKEVAHTYFLTYVTPTSYRINVKEFPGVCLSVLHDNTLGYVLKPTDEFSEFMVMNIGSDTVNIKQGGKCLGYNGIREKIEKQHCDTFSTEQRVQGINPTTGDILDDKEEIDLKKITDMLDVIQENN